MFLRPLSSVFVVHIPEVVRGERLDDGEDDVVDTGDEEEEDVVGEADLAPRHHDDVFQHAEHQDLHDPRREVPQGCYHVSVGGIVRTG